MAIRRFLFWAFALTVTGCGVGRATEGAVEARSSALDADFTRQLTRTDIVSDLPGALVLDETLVNAWGLAFSPSGIAWVSSNERGLAELYNSAGAAVRAPITVPPPPGSPGPAAPTGMVFNASALTFGGDRFIMSTEDGTIAGWQASNGGSAMLRADNSAAGAIYKGIAIGAFQGHPRLFATDFHHGKVDAFDETYAPVSTSGGFEDPRIPTGFAPFNVQAIGGALVVTYARQDEDGEDDVAGVGNGFVDLFDTDGRLLSRLATRGGLNSPWGVALEPADFGSPSRRLLIGNFGDGHINIYRFDGTSATPEGQFHDAQGGPLVIDGLWALVFGPGAGGSSAHTLYFTAGPAGETHGIFGALELQER